MKIDHNVAAVLLLGLAAGTLRGPEISLRPELDGLKLDPRRYRPDRYRMPQYITANNRLHTERARAGSVEETARIAEGEAKRNAKLARRAARAPK